MGYESTLHSAYSEQILNKIFQLIKLNKIFQLIKLIKSFNWLNFQLIKLGKYQTRYVVCSLKECPLNWKGNMSCVVGHGWGGWADGGSCKGGGTEKKKEGRKQCEIVSWNELWAFHQRNLSVFFFFNKIILNLYWRPVIAQALKQILGLHSSLVLVFEKSVQLLWGLFQWSLQLQQNRIQRIKKIC